MLTESLRHLLSVHNGKLELDQLPQLFHQAFGHLPDMVEDSKIQEWMSGTNILSVASQVVHLNNNRWLVWAPGAYQYPLRTTTVSARLMYNHPPSVMLPTNTVSSFVSVTNENSHILHGYGSISSSSSVGTVTSPSQSKRVPGSMKKNMAIKFPSPSIIKAKEVIPPLVESSNDEL